MAALVVEYCDSHRSFAGDLQQATADVPGWSSRCFDVGGPVLAAWLSNIAALAVRAPATSSESSCVVFNCVKYLIDSVSAICSV